VISIGKGRKMKLLDNNEAIIIELTREDLEDKRFERKLLEFIRQIDWHEILGV
jgi:hypothetical protein